ncbi:MAG: hypothetical protein SFU25_11455 [Candidatus Caenarcaniphilales bacterium]|nr:hypothetical protein [Candidatus Caenarcaniphilales bacterium]
MFLKIFTFLFGILLLFAFYTPVNAIEVEPKEITLTVTNVPVNQPSVFIPLRLSSDEIELYRAELKDIFVKGYIVSIEKDQDGRLLGVSFADLRSKTLPESLVTVIKVRQKPKSSSKAKKEINEEIQENAEEPEKAKPAKSPYPKNITLTWEAPWAYTKPTKKLSNSFAGFNMLETGIMDSADLEAKNIKKKAEKEKSKNRDFYIKSLGQTLVRNKRGGEQNSKDIEFAQPLLREIGFFTFIPEDVSSNKLYIPLLTDEVNSIKLASSDKGLNGNILFRVVSNNLLEVSTVNPESKLPSGSLVSGILTLEQNPNVLINKISVGSVLTEPSETIPGIQVQIVPGSIFLGKPSSNPSNAF